MDAISSLLGWLLQFGLVFYLLGLGISLIVGQAPGAKQYTKWVGKFTWKICRRTLKTLTGLAADFFKWAHSKL